MTGRWRAAAGALAIPLALLGCSVAGPPPPRPQPLTRPAAQGVTSAGQARELARIVNEHRRRRGKAPLIWDERIERVAQAHSADMARRRFFSHTNPDGRDPFERLRAAGLRYRAAAENIGEGQRDPEEMLDDWLGSAGHRRNLESGTYTHHGIGLHQRHWTHVFVTFATK